MLNFDEWLKTIDEKNWIQGAVKHPGAFTQWCKSQGYDGVTQDCINKGKSAGGTTAKRANLAQTFRKMD